MLKKLRLRLTILATVLTGGVLLIMTLLALSISEKGLRTSSENAFQSNLNSIIVKLQNDQVVASSWLAQMESSEELIISISDSDSPLQFQGSWSPRTDRAILIERAQARYYDVDPARMPASLSGREMQDCAFVDVELLRATIESLGGSIESISNPNGSGMAYPPGLLPDHKEM